MGLFSKKEPVPQIPVASGLPELPSMPKNIEDKKKDLPELPSFPSNSKHENFNQEMVKSAVTDSSEENDDDKGIPELPKTNSSSFSLESSSGMPPKLAFPTPSMPPKEEPEEISPLPPMKMTTPPVRQSTVTSPDPIFVRIDKFQESQKSFNNIKDMVNEMENVLQKIKEVKTKEDAEIKSWSEDAEKIKEKLSQIDSDIFSQI